ncbi:MAG: PDZ domain-containing protein, partial [Terriglobia bacterium]
EEDFLETLNAVSLTDFSDFWKRNIASTAELDYNRYLRTAGLFLDAHHAQPSPYAGISSMENSDHVVAIQDVLPETPAARDGLSAGDVVLAVDGERVNQKSLESILKEKKVGQKVKITIYRENRLLNIDVTLGSHEEVTYSIQELNNPTELQKKIRVGWLGKLPDSKEPKRELHAEEGERGSASVSSRLRKSYPAAAAALSFALNPMA